MRPRGALAFGAQLGGLALALGLHAPEDGLHVGLGQIDALDADVDDLDTKDPSPLDSPGDRMVRINSSRLSRTTAWKLAAPSTRRSEDSRMAPIRIGANALVAQRLKEQQRVGDR